MNQKTAKLLRRVATTYGVGDKPLKRHWLKKDSKERARVRRTLKRGVSK